MTSTTTHGNAAGHGGAAWQAYFRQTRRPLTCLCFLVPLLAIYEAGVLWSMWQGNDWSIAGAHAWMIIALDWLGYGGLYLPPVIVMVVLMGWHVVEGHPWRVGRAVLLGMFVESVVLALVLVALSYVVLGPVGRGMPATVSRSFHELLMYLGAGIYEETLFRLLLLPLIYGLALAVGLAKRPAAAVAVVGSAVVFAAAHHLGPQGQPWAAAPLVFRSLAGALFAVVFVTRGFGITVGAHAAYDILIG